MKQKYKDDTFNAVHYKWTFYQNFFPVLFGLMIISGLFIFKIQTYKAIAYSK